MIILTATLQSKKGKEGELEKALLYMVAETTKEKGILEYRFHKSTSVPGNYFFYEKYENQESFNSHIASPHFKNTFEKINDMLAEEPVMNTYDFIKGIPE